MKNEKWYVDLEPDGQYICDIINKYHNYFSWQDRKYKIIVRTLKIFILFLAMLSTIICGVKDIIDSDLHTVIGITVTSSVTFFTAVSAYFNFEEYWIRNITIHIELNILRNSFVLDAIAGKIDNKSIETYKKHLDDIQKRNITYWEKAIKRM